jgi:hypothetical protein
VHLASRSSWEGREVHSLGVNLGQEVAWAKCRWGPLGLQGDQEWLRSLVLVLEVQELGHPRGSTPSQRREVSSRSQVAPKQVARWVRC